MSICTYLAHMHGSVRSGTYCVYSNTYHYVPNLNYVPICTSFICDNTYQYVSATKYIPIRTVVYIPICTKIHTNLEILEIRTPDWPNYVPHFVIRTTMHRNSCWWGRRWASESGPHTTSFNAIIWNLGTPWYHMSNYDIIYCTMMSCGCYNDIIVQDTLYHIYDIIWLWYQITCQMIS